MTKGSKFAGLRSMRAQREQQLETGDAELPVKVETKETLAPHQARVASPSEPTGVPPQRTVARASPEAPIQRPSDGETRRRPGRPPGKRSNPDYHPLTILVHGPTYLEMKRRLIGRDEDVSDVINALLRRWISEQ